MRRAVWAWLTKPRGRVRTARARKRRKQRGVAMIAVMVSIAIMLVISNEFGTTTNVDMIAAANYRDQMRSHFLAHSAMNLSELVIRIQKRFDNMSQGGGAMGSMLQGIKITDFADQVLLAFCGSPEEVQSAVGFSSSTVKGLGADIGTCGLQGPSALKSMDTDDKLINLNCANDTTAAPAIWQAVYALMYFPAYDSVFDENAADGYKRDRQTQANALLDYVDTNSMAGSARGGAAEDYGYEALKDPYKAKNNYIDTVGEIHQIRGVDDRFWTLFGSAFTVYGGCTINLSAVDNPQLLAGILSLAAKNPNDPVVQDPKKLFALAALVSKAKEFGETFTKLDEFVAFVKDPSSSITMLASQGSTLQGSAAGAALQNGVPGLSGGQKLGLELDPAKLRLIASIGPYRTYRIHAWGEIERKQKMADGSPVFPPIRTTITGVWDQKVTPQNVRKPPVPKGAWVFLKEE